MIHPFLWEKDDQNAIKMALIPQTFIILSERMSSLELLNCKESYILIMAQYVNLLRGLEEWSLILCHKQKYKYV